MLTKRHVVGAGYDPQCPSLLLQRLEVYHDLDAGVVYPYGIGPVGVPLEEVPLSETALVAFRPSPDKARTQ